MQSNGIELLSLGVFLMVDSEAFTKSNIRL